MAEVYDPAAWLAPTLRVAPTLSVCEPVALRVPVVAGLLVKVETVILFAPLVMVVGVAGRVMV